LSARPQRQEITNTDANIAGEGEGPLAPIPVLSGFLSGALNPAAAEWVHARLMGFDPKKIPLVNESFTKFSHSVTCFEPEEIRVRISDGEKRIEEIGPILGRCFEPPKGWQGHCELEGTDEANDRATGSQILVA
jgi:uncharacterized protein (DUF362 family)